MKNIVLVNLLILSCLTAGIAGADNNLSANFPAKALVFLQADNVTGFIDSYLKSDFGRKYLQTASFKDFSRSKLYLKLSDRFDGWEKLTNFNIDINNIRQFAGGESAAAVYDIGKISVFFMTKVTYAQASKSRLFRLRDKFDVVRIQGRDYFVKESSGGDETFIFGYVKNLFIIATDSALFEKSIALINKKTSGSLGEDKKYTAAVKDLDGDLILWMDTARLTADNYFRTYWLYKNISGLKWIESAAAGVTFKSCGAEETRNYLPFIGSPLTLKTLSDGQLAGTVPRGYDFFALTANFTIGELTDEIISGGWRLPPISKDQADTPSRKALKELRDEVKRYIEKSKPAEKMNLVLSDTGDNPFDAEIAGPVLVRQDKPELNDLKSMLGKLGGYISVELGITAGLLIKVTSTAGWHIIYIDTPYLFPGKPFIAYKGNMVAFSRGLDIWKKMQKSGAGVKIPDGAVSYSRLSFSATGTKLLKLAGQHEKSPGWSVSSNREFFTKNMASLFNVMNKIEFITVTDRVIYNKLQRKISYKCK